MTTKTTPDFRAATAELYQKVEHCVSASGRPVRIDVLLLTHIDQALKAAYDEGRRDGENYARP